MINIYKNLFSEIIGWIYIFTIYVHNHGIFVCLPSIVSYFNGQGCFPYARGTVASDVRVTCPCWGPVRGKFRQATWPWTGYMRATNWRRPTDYCNELAKATPMSRLSELTDLWMSCNLVPGVSHLPAQASLSLGREDERPWERGWMSCRSFARTLFGSNYLIMINNGQ